MEAYKILKMHKHDSDITVATGSIFQFPIHMHSYYEMTLYEPFDGTISVNDTVFTMDTPTAILIAPFDFHRSEITGSQKGRYIKIAFATDLPLEEPAPDCSLILRNICEDDFLIRLFQEIAKTLPLSAYRKQLVYSAVLALIERGTRIRPIKNTGSYGLVKKAVGIIHENFSRNITLSSVAAELSVSSQYLSRIFKENIGINFSTFLTGVRLRRASKLLAETQESITHICEICGYRNFSHFLRSFKSMFGCSASAYRKNHGNRDV